MTPEAERAEMEKEVAKEFEYVWTMESVKRRDGSPFRVSEALLFQALVTSHLENKRLKEEIDRLKNGETGNFAKKIYD